MKVANTLRKYSQKQSPEADSAAAGSKAGHVLQRAAGPPQPLLGNQHMPLTFGLDPATVWLVLLDEHVTFWSDLSQGT